LINITILNFKTKFQKKYLACSHPIYCTGSLLHTIQTSRLYNDSKTFVDKPTRLPPAIVLEAFNRLPPDPTKEILREFVDEYFFPVGTEMKEEIPTDWKEDPAFLEQIQDSNVREWAKSLNSIWLKLFRRFDHSMSCKDCFSSVLLPHGFVIPGGRFREIYYWDTYWVVEGLLISEMYETVKGIIENFFYLIKVYGFIPNGARIYYSNRSQPPFLTRIVDAYIQKTNDLDFLVTALPYLDQEYQFWMTYRTTQVPSPSGKVYNMNHYSVTNDSPRPESYAEDLHLVEGFDENKQKYIYAQMASGAETGWDYSSRWFEKETLDSIIVSELIPVDLNAIMYDVEAILSKFHIALGNTEMGSYYATQANIRLDAIDKLMWNETESAWQDWNTKLGRQTEGFYLSNFFPLWSKSHAKSPETLTKVTQKIQKTFSYKCGLPTSMKESGEQWDYPNAWAPIIQIVAAGLENIETVVPEAGELALSLMEQWLSCNHCGWSETGGVNNGHMFEKYDVNTRGVPGGGGEYEVQMGFGWTNGVVLQFISRHPDRWSLTHCSHLNALFSF